MATLDPDSPFGRLAHHLSALTDPRQARRPVHLLDELLLMSLGTFFTGGRTFVDMEHFAHGHEGWRRTDGPRNQAVWARVYLKNNPALRLWTKQGFTRVVEHKGQHIHVDGEHLSVILERSLQGTAG